MKISLPILCVLLSTAAARAALSPASADITLTDFKLSGDLTSGHAAFTLNTTVHVADRKGGSLTMLSGPVALTELGDRRNWNIRAEQDRYILSFDHGGEFPVQLKFDASVEDRDEWKNVAFHVAPGPLQHIVLQGLAADTQFEFKGAARPERTNNVFVSYLPADGLLNLSWKEGRPETEGKLFYAAEMLSQISVSPGLMRQVALLNFKVMQGEMDRVVLLLHGPGEVTRVQGDQVLAWNLADGGADRRLIVQLNQPQKDQFSLQVQMQTPLDAFPQSVDAMQARPEDATRFAGYIRIVNDGAVRLEVAQASGMSQISPDQFPENDATRATLKTSGTQCFAYRFSGAETALKIQADRILPEIGVSEMLNYNHGDNELAIDAELELEVREAPLRELLLHIPRGYAVARLNASDLSDYFTHENELRLVFGQPISGRQIIQLRLEQNQAPGETNWTLPRIEVSDAKSVRGYVGISADAGFRLTPDPRTLSGLTEIATAFFPEKVAGLQTAFRLSDPAWTAAVRVERMPQTVQADVFHLFSIGEGIAYGSSVMNYLVSGAPMSAFKVELSDEYFNVEFTGKDIRSWQKVDGGYLVQLHTPVSGAYTLLATYERPFKAQGETLAFTGARPVDAQTEQGHTIVVSSYQFQVKPVDVSPGLLPLEPGEVPPEYRLFFDAPILAAYRYASRPFNLKLALSPLAQGDSLSLIVDRASLETRISKEGQVLTDVRYFVKSRGNTHFRVTLPEGTSLWSATVNGAPVVPVMDGKANLIPLPQDSDAVLDVQLKLAGRSDNPKLVGIAAPVVASPVLLAQWKLAPDNGRRLVYVRGSLAPAEGVPDTSGFASWGKLFSGWEAGEAFALLVAALVSVGAALILWHWAAGDGVHKYSARHLGGAAIGLVAIALAVVFLTRLGHRAEEQMVSSPGDITILAPVQQAGSAFTVEVSNLPDKISGLGVAVQAWPAWFAVAIWIYAWRKEEPPTKALGQILGWMLLVWAALRMPGGAMAFAWVIEAFLLWQAAIPALRRLWRLPHRPITTAPAPEGGAASAAAIVIGLLCLTGLPARGAEQKNAALSAPVLESVVHDIRIEDKYALGSAKIRLHTLRGQVLTILEAPAVLTRLNIPRALKLVESADHKSQQLLAQSDGTFDIEIQYQMEVSEENTEGSMTLPARGGLINRLNVTVADSDVDVLSSQAVSTRCNRVGSNTVATLVLAPSDNIRFSWQPRSRDVKREKPVFYAEVAQLYVPSAGVIEGAEAVSIRPAQGELGELVLNVPKGATITDVMDLSSNNAGGQSIVSLWRFDPDSRKLRVTLNPAQSHPFALLVRSQIATGPLPFEQSAGLFVADNAAGQIGLLGIATGTEVQLDTVNAYRFSPINLEDFSTNTLSALQSQIPGLTLRRAFRYSDTAATAIMKASPVEPDIRVETQNTLSLGEDRTVLAADITADITRAGIFRLSFLMPPGFDVESITGGALSHWTESKTNADRVITLHLNGKTEGRQQFAISLAGPGVKAATNWTAPQLFVREAAKQRGTLLIVPEQGMRLQVASRDGVTQLDPQKAGIQQKGVLAFRVLQAPANLALEIEQVEPWIQVTSLQHAIISEGQVKVTANLQYQIENTGLKSFRVLIPANAEGVRFDGDQVADFLALPDAVTNQLQAWEIKLQRRVIGQYLLQAAYRVPVPGQARETSLRGVEAADVNLQRGFVTVQSGARLQVSVEAPPAALQPAEWQSIPRALQQDLPASAANFAYRLVDASFELPLKLERHEAAKLLPAHVDNITLDSVVSDDGSMLTRVRLEILPGDKRLLNLTLPKDARFWFAFVNDNGVWPWREQDRILIPLEQQSAGGKPEPVEVFYSGKTGIAGLRSLDLELLAPKFDLPLENITWRISLGDKWRVKSWNGALQLQRQELVPQLAAIDVRAYLQGETAAQLQRTREAEELFATANDALAQGNPQQARRAFEAACGLSSHDAAFNEDARVQLHNVKLQQALIGLNMRQAATAGETGSLSARFRDVEGHKELNYTQQDARDILDRNSADENAAFMRLAERLIQQQDAVVTGASALRASIPQEGRVLTFTRSVAVDPWADLNIDLKTRIASTASRGFRLLILGVIGLVLGALSWGMQSFPRARPFQE